MSQSFLRQEAIIDTSEKYVHGRFAKSSLGVFGAVIASITLCTIATLLVPRCRPSQLPAARSWISIAASYFGVLGGTSIILQPAVGSWSTGWLGSIMFALSLALVVLLHGICGSKLANITSYGGLTYPYFIRHRLGPTLSHLYGLWGFFLTFAVITSELNNVADIAQSVDHSLSHQQAVWILNAAICVICIALLTHWPIVFRCNLVLFIASSIFCLLSIIIALIHVSRSLPPATMQLAFTYARGDQSSSYFCFLYLKQFVTTLLHPFLWTLLYSAKDAPAWQFGVFSGGSSCLLLSLLASITGLIAWGASQSEVAIDLNDIPTFGIIAGASLRAVLLSGVFCLSLLCVLCAAAGCLVVIKCSLAEHGRKKCLAYPLLYLVFLSVLLIRYFCEDLTPRLNLLVVYGSALLVPALLLSLWPVVSTEGCAWGVCAGTLCVCCFGWSHGHTFVDGFKWWFGRSCIEDMIPYTTSDCTAPWVTIGTATAVTTVWTVLYSQWQFKLYPHVYEAQVRRLMIIQAIAPARALLKASDLQFSMQTVNAAEEP